MASDATQYGTVVCCRTWTVVLFLGGHSYDWNKCALCDTRPVLISNWWEE